MQHEYISSDIAVRIKLAAKAKGVTIATVLENVKLGRNTMANLKTSMPKADNLAKIADYLDCSVDYLLGRSAISNSAITAHEKSSTSELTDDEQKMINIFRSLTQIQQGEIIGRAKVMAEENEELHIQKDVG